MSIPFSERILRFLSEPGYRPIKLRPLARMMGIAEEEYGEFREAVDALRRVGRIVYGGGNLLTLPDASKHFIGVYRANPRGFGFVVPENPDAHGDLFIPPGGALDATTGDTVECEVHRRQGRDGESISGRVLRVMQRGHNRFVGELCNENGRWYVKPDGNRLHVPIFLPDAGAKSARAGDQVVVEIMTYPAQGRQATGVIVERLGKRGQPGVDVVSIIREHQIPHEFPEAALEDARRAIGDYDPEVTARQREDLRQEMIVTIDPDDARDFDDAISLRRMTRGAAAWELGVHIADVSTFVKAGTALDGEARERGNSVYFPRHVIPMLPEVLSNGVCSLQEGEPRLCKSAFIEYDEAGRVVGARFANTIIQSARRLTYRQASGILEGNTGGYPREVVELLRRMDTLARAIQKRRLADGQIVLELPEIELVLDDENRVVDAHKADTSYSHTIIEMFMVEANEAVARLFEGRNIPFLRRIHPEPDEEGQRTLGRFLKVAGHVMPRKMERADVQKLLANIKGRPEAFAVNLAVLKSMEQAVYSPKAEGHYALASDCYTHFTSPIRRYTDLTIHRTLQEVLEAGEGGQRGGHKGGQKGGRTARREAGREAGRAIGKQIRTEADGQDLAGLGRHLSFTERRAADAERELRTVKILQLLSEHVGEKFRGVITGVTNFGMFIQHPRFLIDGLVRLDQMPDDFWIVDAKSGCVVGQRTRQRFTIGDQISVEIFEVDVGGRELVLRMPGARAPKRIAAGDGAKIATMASRSARVRKPGGSGHRKGGGGGRSGGGRRGRGRRR